MKIVTKVVLWTIGVIAVLLLLIRFVASPIVTTRVNEKLAALPQYSGHVQAIQLELWRGAVTANDLQLTDRNEPNAGSVVEVKHAALSIAWGPLFKGRVGGHGHVSGVKVHMTKTKKAGSEEKEPDAKKPTPPASRDWQGVLQKAFPIEISRFEIEDATMDFEDRTTQPVAKVTVDQIHLVATDLSNRPSGTDHMPGKVRLQARIAGSGQLTVDVQADAASAQPHFYAKMEVKEIGLVPLHDFLAAYALIDVRAGTFEVFTEVNAAGGHYDGYVKPFFNGLEFKAIPDPNKNFVQHAATKVASAVTDLLKNDRNQVATKAPFKGDFANNEVDVWTTIENLLRNAFVQSIREGLEGQSPGGK